MKNTFLIIALNFCLLTYAQFLSCENTSFGGNTQLNITTINPQITISNISGEAPFTVQVSAVNSTAIGTNRPYEDVAYSWDFGDTSSTNNLATTHPVTGTTMFLNQDQKGPEAAYIYYTSGNFTITLTATAWNGTAYISNTTTTNITVNNWSGETRYFDPTNGSDSNSGTTENDSWQTWSQLETWIEGGNNREALIRRNETYTVTSVLNLNQNNLRIGAYGTGNRPILTLINSNINTDHYFVQINANNNTTVENHIYSDLIIDVNNQTRTSGFRGFANTGNSLSKFSFVNCDFLNSKDRSLWITSGDGNKEYFVLLNCNFNANTGSNQSFGIGRTNYLSFIGGNLIGGNGSFFLDHHMYISYCDHTLIRWTNFGLAITRNDAINFNAWQYDQTNDSDYTLVDGCSFSGTSNGIDFSNEQNDPIGSSFNYVIVQNSEFKEINLTTQGNAILGWNLKNITVRDNIFYNNNFAQMNVQDPFTVYNVYRNKFYASATANQNTILIENGQSGNFVNNIFVNETQVLTRYQFNGDFNAPTNLNIDNNLYYNPINETRTFRLTTNGSTSGYLNFSDWQALGFDANSLVENPLFEDPSNGDFRQLPISDFSFTENNNEATFTNSATIPAFTNTTFLWDFGDGNSSTLENPTHNYSSNDDFLITLTVQNECGSSVFTKNRSQATLVNGLEITNPQIVNSNVTNKHTFIQFDIAWENSWHDTENWDAVWLFVKFRQAESTDAWQHATLNLTGNSSPTGTQIDISNDGKGGFLHRNINGSGTNNFSDVQIRWNYGVDGVTSVSNIDIQVFGVEMVYVPQGSFYLGDGQTINAEIYANFEQGTSGNPYQVTSENAIIIGGGTLNSLGNNNIDNQFTSGSGSLPETGDDFNDTISQNLPAQFPKGFNAFYYMKYEMTQQQYVDMLNCSSNSQLISLTDQSNFFIPGSETLLGNRYGIQFNGTEYFTTEPHLPMVYLDWTRNASFADWTALRPMTELEFEKACRGTGFPVANEFSWGNANADLSDNLTLENQSLTNEGIATGYETNGISGNIWIDAGSQNLNTVARVGIFSANINNTGRVSSGSTFYGAMEMSGNAWERTVSVGDPEGRQFTGLHGDGNLSINGYANVNNWPGIDGNLEVTSNVGVGYRGGGLAFPSPNIIRNARVSSRRLASGFWNLVIQDDGGRFVRTVE